MTELLQRLFRSNCRYERRMLADEIGELLAADMLAKIEAALDAAGFRAIA